MKHFLVTVITDFFDPHGSPDQGGVEKFVTQNGRYALLNPNAYYPEWDVNALVENDKMSDEEFLKSIKKAEYNRNYLHAEDGYNLYVQSYVVKEITEEQAKHFEYIINEYNKF